MQWTFELTLPEFDEAKHLWIIWTDVVVLPDVAVEHVLVVGHLVAEFCSSEPVAFEHQFCF